jgi:hypothetical protein
LIPNPVIERLALPKRFTGPAQDLVALPSREALHGLEELRGGNSRLDKHMNMVRHDHVRFQLVVAQSGIGELHGIRDDPGKILADKPGRPRPSAVEVTVQPDKCIAGRGGPGRRKVRSRQAAVKVPSDEQGLARRLPMGQPALIEGHMRKCSDTSEILMPGGAGFQPAATAFLPTYALFSKNDARSKAGTAAWKGRATVDLS